MSCPSRWPRRKGAALWFCTQLMALWALAGETSACSLSGQPALGGFSMPHVPLLSVPAPHVLPLLLTPAATPWTGPLFLYLLIVLAALALAGVAYSRGYRRASGKRLRPIRTAAQRLRRGLGGRDLTDGLPSDERDLPVEEALGTSERRLQLALDAAQMGVWERDLATDRLRWSPRVEVIFGLDKGTFDGRGASLERLIHPLDRERVAAVWQAAYADPACDHYTATYRIVRPDGQTRWVQSHAQVFRDARQRATDVTGVLWDITDEQEAAAEIERLARFPAENPHPVARVTRAGVLLYANPGSQPFHGTELAEVGKPVSPLWQSWVERAFGSGAPQVFEDAVGERTFSFHVVPIPAADYANLYGADISERIRVQQIAQRYTERLEVLHAIDKGVLAARSTTEIAQAAGAFMWHLLPLRFLAVALIDVETSQVQLVAAESRVGGAWPTGVWLRADGLVALQERLVAGQPLIVEDIWQADFVPERIQALRAGGIGAYLAAPLMAHGIMLGCLVLGFAERSEISDETAEMVTELADQLAIALHNAQLSEQIARHAEELETRVAARTAELQQANSELAAFSYSVSHDLRAPLRAMDGFSRILLEDYAATLDEQAQRYLQLVRASAQQMGELIEALLVLSRLGRRQMERQPVAPAELVAHVLQDLASEREGRAVEVQVLDLPPCHADPTLLRQVYANLLGNALKFTRQRDVARIAVGWSQLEHEGRPQGAYWVRDNGAGFDMRYVDKLFGVFQRLHRAEDFAGTGAGLSIVRRIVQRHGGTVWAEGQVDAGATFYFTLGVDNDR